MIPTLKPDLLPALISEALYPYTNDLVICTKVGAARKPDKSWVSFSAPKNIRASIENNLRTLKLDQLQLVHFRVMPDVTAASYKASINSATAKSRSMSIIFAMASSSVLCQ